jgi:hypothetical protein
MTTDRETLPRRFRSSNFWVGGSIAIGCGLLLVVTSVAATDWDFGGVLVGVLFGVAFTASGVRLLRCGVTANADGVVVRTPLRVRRLAWNAIDHFGLGQFVSGGGRYQAVTLVLNDGSSVKTTNLSTSGINAASSVRECESIVDELNRLRNALA